MKAGLRLDHQHFFHLNFSIAWFYAPTLLLQLLVLIPLAYPHLKSLYDIFLIRFCNFLLCLINFHSFGSLILLEKIRKYKKLLA